MNRPNFRDHTRLERVAARAERADEHYYNNLIKKIDFGCPNLINEDNYGMLVRTAIGMNIRTGHVIGLPGNNFKTLSCKTSDNIKTYQYLNPIDFLTFARINNWAIYSIDYIENESTALEDIELKDIENDLTIHERIILFLGNESFGIPADILFASTRILHIFMPGITPSINVSAAGAIAFHHISHLLNTK